MPDVLLTKRIEFAAAHRYARPEWDEAKNRATFGACYNEPGHGHNYMLEVTVSGEVDEKTGMVVNLFDLKRVLLQVLEEFDHKHMNLDLPYFRDRIPTSENIARLLWQKLEGQPHIGTLHAVRLHEDEDLYAELTAARGLDEATVTRRYQFSAVAVHGEDAGLARWRGHRFDVFVSVGGPIDPVTGMVTDIVALDRLAQREIIQRLDGTNLADVFRPHGGTGERLVEDIWTRLAQSVSSGALERVRLVQSRDLAFDYVGTPG